MKQYWLWLEWSLLFVAAPVAIGFGLRQTPWLLLLLALAAAAGLWLSQRGGFHRKQFWHGEDPVHEWQQLKKILLRFAGSALALIGLVLAFFLFFTHTYIRTRSLRLVCLEHTLYGNLIFTIGLGEFFTQTAIWA